MCISNASFNMGDSNINRPHPFFFIKSSYTLLYNAVYFNIVPVLTYCLIEY
jgi:hypothetical protein